MGDNYAGKQYIVTGSGSGIGHAVASRLIDYDANVVAFTGRSQRLKEIPGNLFSNLVDTVVCDLSEFEQLEQSLTSVLKKTSSLDGVILCHGYGAFGSLEEFSTAQIQHLVNVNLVSYLLICRKVLPVLKKNKKGDIIMIGSEAGLQGGKKGAVYCATKFALNGFVQALRAECAATNVRVSVVNPGMVNTGFFDQLNFSPGENRENYLVPEDIVNAVCLMLDMPQGSVVDQINLSPQKNVVRQKIKENKNRT